MTTGQVDALARLSRTGQNALELRDVGCAFGALRALDAVSMEIKAGERHAILGSNGAGKTTLFNSITGDVPNSQGEILFFGENITRFSTHERIRRGLRRTYQISLLFGRLRLLDNIYLACQGVSNSRYSLARPHRGDPLLSQAETLLEAVHLWDLRHEMVDELSHGQQRQLEVALALAGAPRFILFDEPAAGLSTVERNLLVDILNSMPRHMGYVIIEHDMDVALRVVERVSIMHNGKLIKQGDPAEIEDDQEVQELYLGRQEDG